MTSRVLVTGANGMLGSAACRVFSESWHVTALHRDDRALAPAEASLRVDLTDPESVRRSLGGTSFDLVVHCVGLVNVDECERRPDVAHRANVEATRHLAEATNPDALFVYVSTDQVYGRSSARSEEVSDLKPVNQYGRTKLAGEDIVRSLRPRSLVLRTNVFGTNVKPGRQGSAEWILNSLQSRTPITLFRDYRFSPIHSEFFARVVDELVGALQTGTFNIGSPVSCSKLEFGLTVARAFDLDEGTILSGSIADHSFRAPRPQNLSMDTRKARDHGVSLPDYESSIRSWRSSLNGETQTRAIER